MDVQIEKAVAGDAEEILQVQKVAFAQQARLYDDWELPPLTETVEELEKDFDKSTILKAVADAAAAAATLTEAEKNELDTVIEVS